MVDNTTTPSPCVTAVGFVAGVGLYVATDVISINGKTAREWTKVGVNSLW
ncbi:MAG: hypothetical protein IJM97_04000 [Clostridia bacterium]|nr:hypothetical protein [Clostridia bacterium]